jgi:hypothetical protein
VQWKTLTCRVGAAAQDPSIPNAARPAWPLWTCLCIQLKFDLPGETNSAIQHPKRPPDHLREISWTCGSVQILHYFRFAARVARYSQTDRTGAPWDLYILSSREAEGYPCSTRARAPMGIDPSRCSFWSRQGRCGFCSQSHQGPKATEDAGQEDQHGKACREEAY